jgi:enoyl-CoA hydratase
MTPLSRNRARTFRDAGLDYRLDGGVARVRLNRPRYRNALSGPVLEALDLAFMDASADRDVRAIVLVGAGDHFCSGQDLGTPEEKVWREGRDLEGLQGFERHSTRLYLENHLRWRSLPKPLLVGVQGYCLLGGWMLAASADVVFAADDARFLGALFEYFSIPWEMSPRRAKEILFDPQFLSAAQAASIGVINRVTARDRLEDELMAYARAVAKQDPDYLAAVKLAVNQAQDAQGFTTAVRSAHSIYLAWRAGDREAGAAAGPDGLRRPIVQAALDRERSGLPANG